MLEKVLPASECPINAYGRRSPNYSENRQFGVPLPSGYSHTFPAGGQLACRADRRFDPAHHLSIHPIFHEQLHVVASICLLECFRLNLSFCVSFFNLFFSLWFFFCEQIRELFSHAGTTRAYRDRK